MPIFADIPFFGALLLAAFGVLFCAFGLKSIQQTRVFRKSGTPHEAVVTHVAVFGHGEGRRSYQPTFTFLDASGKEQSKATNGGSSGYKFDVGSTHTVLDLPGHPHVVVANTRDSDVFSYALIAGGIMCLCMGLSGMVL